jgi:hypothetical protein
MSMTTTDGRMGRHGPAGLPDAVRDCDRPQPCLARQTRLQGVGEHRVVVNHQHRMPVMDSMIGLPVTDRITHVSQTFAVDAQLSTS